MLLVHTFFGSNHTPERSHRRRTLRSRSCHQPVFELLKYDPTGMYIPAHFSFQSGALGCFWVCHFHSFSLWNDRCTRFCISSLSHSCHVNMFKSQRYHAVEEWTVQVRFWFAFLRLFSCFTCNSPLTCLGPRLTHLSSATWCEHSRTMYQWYIVSFAVPRHFTLNKQSDCAWQTISTALTSKYYIL